MTYLDYLQKINNFLYKYFGLNRVTLHLQIKINTKRHEQNIVDHTEIINFDDKGEYIQ